MLDALSIAKISIRHYEMKLIANLRNCSVTDVMDNFFIAFHLFYEVKLHDMRYNFSRVNFTFSSNFIIWIVYGQIVVRTDPLEFAIFQMRFSRKHKFHILFNIRHCGIHPTIKEKSIFHARLFVISKFHLHTVSSVVTDVKSWWNGQEFCSAINLTYVFFSS